MAIQKIISIGTRDSPLALAQASEVCDRLKEIHPDFAHGQAIEIIKIKTSGDLNQDLPLSEIGGKGLFSKEIDLALLEGRIDIAVHSVKDLETRLVDGIVLVSALEREDVREAMLSNKVEKLAELPEGSVVGTSSLRRQAQILRLFPHLRCVPFRGNIQTRIRKLGNNEIDATLLAMAGLNRLGISHLVKEIFEPEILLPAVAQGAIGITCRRDDQRSIEIARVINHENTMICVKCERAMLASLDGSCRTPIGGLALLGKNGELWLRGMIARIDGSEVFQTSREGQTDEAESLGYEVGDELRYQAGPNYFL